MLLFHLSASPAAGFHAVSSRGERKAVEFINYPLLQSVKQLKYISVQKKSKLTQGVLFSTITKNNCTSSKQSDVGVIILYDALV